MSYSLDLRKKVIDYVENGGSITKAAALFNIGRATIYRWLSREKLEATKVKHRQRKLDWKALSKDVQENPEARLRDRAEKFGVRPSAICYALKKMKGEHLTFVTPKLSFMSSYFESLTRIKF